MNVGHAEGAGRTNGQQWMVPNTKEIYGLLTGKRLDNGRIKLDVYDSDFHSFDKGVGYVPEALTWLFQAK